MNNYFCGTDADPSRADVRAGPGYIMADWSRAFDDPITLPGGAPLACDNGLVAGAGLRSYASILERNLQGGFYASDNAGGCNLLFSADGLCTD